MADSPSIIVFDGVCVLCSRWVDFVLRRDQRGRYKLAAMQTTSGRELLIAHGIDPDDPLSFLLLEGGKPTCLAPTADIAERFLR
jgi:predicted DCC family thiol-disulfide oxidoreductase YuxK